MSRIAIYNKNGVQRQDSEGNLVAADSVEYSGRRMSERFVSVTVKSAFPIAFEEGDYIDFRSERFVLDSNTNILKKARKGSYGEAFCYDSMRFESLGTKELVGTEFLDVVLHDNGTHYTSLPKVSIFAETLDDLLDMIQANLNLEHSGWKLYSPSLLRSQQRGITTSEWQEVYGNDASTNADYEVIRKNIEIENGSCWDALLKVNEVFKERFTHVGRNVVVRGKNKSLRTLYYGKGRGLYEINRVPDPDQEQVVTKLRAFGSDENISPRYYYYKCYLPYVEIYYPLNGDPPEPTFHADSDYSNDHYFFAYIKYLAPKSNIDNEEHGLSYYLRYRGNAVSRLPEDFGPEGWLRITTGSTTYDMYRARVLSNNAADWMDYQYHYKYFEMSDSEVDYTPIPGVHRYAYDVEMTHLTTQETTRHIMLDYSDGKDYYFDWSDIRETFPGSDRYIRVSKMWIISGIIDMSEWPRQQMYHLFGPSFNDHMAVLNLMLPGYPEESLKDFVLGNGGVRHSDGSVTWEGYRAFFSDDEENPYIESTNKDNERAFVKTVYFDGNNDLDKIYPTISEMTIGELKASDPEYVEPAINDCPNSMKINENVRDVYTEDDGIVYNYVGSTPYTFDPKQNIGKPMAPKFVFYTHPLGFELQGAIERGGGEASISMLDGMCGGREFEITAVEEAYSVPYAAWKVTCKRKEDASLERWFPYGCEPTTQEEQVYAGYYIAKGDAFVFTGIRMPDVYVKAASVRLLKAALKYLSENDHRRYLFEVKIDELFMARDNEAHGAESIHNMLEVDDVFVVKDSDVGDIAARIDTLTIKLSGEGVPTYSVTLKTDTKLSGFLTTHPTVFTDMFEQVFE